MHQNFDKPHFLSAIVGQKLDGVGVGWGWGGGGVGVTDATSRLFMKGVGLSLLFFFSLSELFCLRSSMSKYNTSAVNNFIVFFYA